MGRTVKRTIDMGHLIVVCFPVYKAYRKLTFYYSTWLVTLGMSIKEVRDILSTTFLPGPWSAGVNPQDVSRIRDTINFLKSQPTPNL